MKLHKVLLFGFLLLQPGWLLANTSWAELSPSQQRTLSYYAPYWHKLHYVQKKRLLRAANSSRRAEIASHSIKRSRHGHFKGYSGLHHKKKAIRHGLRSHRSNDISMENGGAGTLESIITESTFKLF